MKASEAAVRTARDAADGLPHTEPDLAFSVRSGVTSRSEP